MVGVAVPFTFDILVVNFGNCYDLSTDHHFEVIYALFLQFRTILTCTHKSVQNASHRATLVLKRVRTKQNKNKRNTFATSDFENGEW